MMNKDLQQLIGLGIGIAGVITAANSFSSELKTVEHRGLTLASGAALIVLGATLFTKIEDVENDVRVLRW